MADELSELKENAEHGEGKLAPVTVSLLGHRSDTEALLAQTRATDQWAYYQAKDTRQHSYETFIDQLSLSSAPAAQTGPMKEKYGKEVERYSDQEKEAEAKANEDESDVKTNLAKADKFDLGEVLLEAALVICSITLLTKNRIFWGLGLILGAIGIAFGVWGLTIH
jgi:Domain of unknown function (DUF4337)